jgi:uracil-DNA glycosylase
MTCSNLNRIVPILNDIAACRVCADYLPNLPRPVLVASKSARLLIVGQAPGRRVQQSGIAWSDASGQQLRAWLQLSPEQFYDAQRIAIMPLGFCYPGKGASGDLPPRPECAPLWHARLLRAMPDIQLTLLVGSYAQAYYLQQTAKPTLTETVAHFTDYLPRFFPLPHPSPRNRFWLSRNPWFVSDVLPALRQCVAAALR